MLEWLKDLLKIYTWTEFWIVVSVPSVMMGIWILFAKMLAIKNDVLRTVAIWALIFILTLLSSMAKAADAREAIFK